MSKYSGFDLYERDVDLEKKEGFEIKFGEDVSITVLRAGGSNNNFVRTYSRITQPFRRQLQAETLDQKTNDRLHAQIFAESIIIGWKGIVDNDTGEEVPFNKEEVVSFLVSLPEVFKIVRQQAEDMDNFRRSEIEEEAQVLGNS